MKTLFTILILLIQPFIGVSQTSNSSPILESNKSDQFFIPSDKFAIGELIESKKKNLERNLRKKDVVIALIGEAETFKKSIASISNDLFLNTFSEIEQLLDDNKLELNQKNQQLAQKASKLYSDFGVFYPNIYRSQNFDFPELFVDKLLNEAQNINREVANNISSLIYDSGGRPIILSTILLNNLKRYLDNAILEKLKKDLSELSNSEIQRLNSVLLELNKQIEKDSNELVLLQRKLVEQETHIDDLAIKIGLPLFCLTILLLFLGPKILSLFDKNDTKESKDHSSQNVLLEISTVLLLTMSILILGLSGKIQSDVLGTLIGGISGYVLNRIGSSQKSTNEENKVP